MKRLSLMGIDKRDLISLIGCALLSVLAYIFALGLMFTSGYMISLAAMVPATILALHIPSIFVRIFGIGKPFIDYFEKLGAHDRVLRATSSLRVKLFESLDRVTRRPGYGFTSGEAVSAITEDIKQMQDFLLRSLLPQLTGYILFVVIALCCSFLSAELCICMVLILGILTFGLTVLYKRVYAKTYDELIASKDELYATLTDTVSGIRDWMLSGREDLYIANIRESTSRVHVMRAKLKRKSRELDFIEGILCALGIAFVSVWAVYAFTPTYLDLVGSNFTTDIAKSIGNVAPYGEMPYSLNWIAAFSICLFPVFDAFIRANRAALKRAEQVPAFKNMEDLERIAQDQSLVPEIGKTHEGQAVDVREVIVLFGEGERCALSGVSLQIPEGQKVAILGKSGSGKTTLANVICGRVGLECGSVSVSDKVCYIEQNAHIFNQTLRENLLVAKGDASDEEILDALIKAGLKDLYESLPGGLDGELLEDGANVSGGERRRLALARALLQDRRIILLDEPFVFLDPETESGIFETILDVFSQHTIILITHHLQGIQKMDRVIFLKDGKISKDGIPNILAKSDEEFKSLLSLEAVV